MEGLSSGDVGNGSCHDHLIRQYLGDWWAAAPLDSQNKEIISFQNVDIDSNNVDKIRYTCNDFEFNCTNLDLIKYLISYNNLWENDSTNIGYTTEVIEISTVSHRSESPSNTTLSDTEIASDTDNERK